MTGDGQAEPDPREAIDRPLLDVLARRSLCCPRCEYDLRGVTQLRCPECGTPLTRAALVHPDRRAGYGWRAAFIVLVAFAALGTGTVLVGVVWMLVGAARLSLPSWKPGALMLLVGALLLVELRVLWLDLYRSRALWDRPERLLRWILLASALIAAIVVVVLM